MTHDEWQAQVVDLAHAYRWKHLHVRRSIGRGRRWTTATNLKGWPDLFLWHETQHRQIGAELKIPPDKPTAEQLAVLESLARSGVETHVWRPEDLDDVHATLRSIGEPQHTWRERYIKAERDVEALAALVSDVRSQMAEARDRGDYGVPLDDLAMTLGGPVLAGTDQPTPDTGHQP